MLHSLHNMHVCSAAFVRLMQQTRKPTHLQRDMIGTIFWCLPAFLMPRLCGETCTKPTFSALHALQHRFSHIADTLFSLAQPAMLTPATPSARRPVAIATSAVLQHQFVQAKLLLACSEYTAVALSLGIHGQTNVPGF